MKPEELRKKLDGGEEIMVLDVREKDEFDQGEKIDGSENVPMGRVFVEVQKGALPKDKKIVTVCKTGGRCEIVARELRQKGYDIEHLEGGIEAWKKSSVPHEDACSECGADHDFDDCLEMRKCPACAHAHNHRGCTDCDCALCPTCGHRHGAHA
ncbi:MAG: Beta-lactamase hydrolase-like protein [Candidatus Parcubacteria bacterium]